MKRDLPAKAARPAKSAKAAGSPTPARRPAAAGKAKGDENWDRRLGFLMHDVSRLRRVVFDDFMKPVGLTRSQWWILAHLSRHDGMIQSDLANLLDIGKASLGGLVDRLEASRFIERRADEADRRVKRVYLTPKGTQMMVEMQVRGHEMSERILAGLDDASRHALVDMLTLVKRNLLDIKGADSVDSEPGED